MKEFFKPTVKKVLHTFLFLVFGFAMMLFFGIEPRNLWLALVAGMTVGYFLSCFVTEVTGRVPRVVKIAFKSVGILSVLYLVFVFIHLKFFMSL